MGFPDFVYAFRALRNSPAFGITAVVTTALGIGSSTAIFSVANYVLLRPLPYASPNRLVLARNDLERRNVKDFPLSDADFLDLQKGAKSAFEDFAAVNTGRGRVLQRDGAPEQVRFANVSTNFFRVMGAQIEAGRNFEASDGLPQPSAPAPSTTPAGQPLAPRLPVYAILSPGYFERRFGANRTVIGQLLPVAGGGPQPLIVGVLSPGFDLLFPPEANIERCPDIWFAARIPYDTANRNNVRWRAIGRMRPGATLEQAQREAETITAQLRRVNPIARTAGQYLRIELMKQHLVSEVRPAILALMGGVTFLLLIACANV
ncbi:MAG: ABC transporter permease, partial [Acidobacteriia bacterium]|nr:ABC transporter permease [Terriglobia bacterium]